MEERIPTKSIEQQIQELGVDPQVFAELEQFREHLWDKYGQPGLWDEGLQERLYQMRKKKGKYKDAYNIAAGMLMINGRRTDGNHPQGWDYVTDSDTEMTANALINYGNTPEGRRTLREFLGLKKPVVTHSVSKQSERKVPGSAPILPRGFTPNPLSSEKPGVRMAPEQNPFVTENSQLQQQVDLLRNDPAFARKLIKDAGRDPAAFGL